MKTKHSVKHRYMTGFVSLVNLQTLYLLCSNNSPNLIVFHSRSVSKNMPIFTMIRNTYNKVVALPFSYSLIAFCCRFK